MGTRHDFAVEKFIHFYYNRGVRENMAEKDMTEKILEDYNDVFADIMNVLVFHGERRIKPSSLRKTEVRSMYKADDSKMHEQERDIAKLWQNGRIQLAICGIENQTKSERLMPVRVFSYEGASYRSQILKNKRKIIPVITIVLYFGKEHWTKPRTLKELMKIPEGLEEYLNDCKIHVFEISWLTDEQVAMFRSDFKVVANFFVNKRKNKNYIPDDKTTIKHVDEVLKLLSVMTGDRQYEEIFLDDKKGEVKTMCSVAERLVNQGRTEERAEVIGQMLRNGRSPQEIADFCGYDISLVKEVEEHIKR
jgi:uncharacterized protein (DUF433 family)